MLLYMPSLLSLLAGIPETALPGRFAVCGCCTGCVSESSHEPKEVDCRVTSWQVLCTGLGTIVELCTSPPTRPWSVDAPCLADIIKLPAAFAEATLRIGGVGSYGFNLEEEHLPLAAATPDVETADAVGIGAETDANRGVVRLVAGVISNAAACRCRCCSRRVSTCEARRIERLKGMKQACNRRMQESGGSKARGRELNYYRKTAWLPVLL